MPASAPGMDREGNGGKWEWGGVGRNTGKRRLDSVHAHLRPPLHFLSLSPPHPPSCCLHVFGQARPNREFTTSTWCAIKFDGGEGGSQPPCLLLLLLMIDSWGVSGGQPAPLVAELYESPVVKRCDCGLYHVHLTAGAAYTPPQMPWLNTLTQF